MSRTSETTLSLLRVAQVGVRNNATTPPDHATSRATNAQHEGLKALAQAALARNTPRNNCATNPPEPRNKPVAEPRTPRNKIRADLLAAADREKIDRRVVLMLGDDEVDAIAGQIDAVPEAERDDYMAAFVRALRDSDMHRRGIALEHETVAGVCRSCGPVWLGASVAAMAPVVDGRPYVLGCPWCHVRARGATIPRPPPAA